MQTSIGGNRNLDQSQDRGKAWEWLKGKLLSEKTELIGLAIMAVALYGLVLFAHYRAFEARTIVGL